MLKILFLILICSISVFSLETSKLPLLDEPVTPIASTVKKNEGISPSPTPPIRAGSLFEELCTKAAREVEASRIIIEAQTTHIENLKADSKAKDDVIKSHINIQNEQTKLIEQYKDLDKKNVEIQKNLETQLANKDKQIEILQKSKCGFKCQALRVLMGVGIGVLLL